MSGHDHHQNVFIYTNTLNDLLHLDFWLQSSCNIITIVFNVYVTYMYVYLRLNPRVNKGVKFIGLFPFEVDFLAGTKF